MSEVIEHIQGLIIEGERTAALQLLRQIAKHDPRLKSRDSIYIQMLGQHNRLERQIAEGTLSESKRTLQENQLDRNLHAEAMRLPSDVTYPPGYTAGDNGRPPSTGGGQAVPTDPITPTPAPTAAGIVKILMLMANPRETVRLNLEREHARIHEELSGQHTFFKLQPKYDVRITELNQAIIKERPNIVHFSGHGRSSKPVAADPNDPFSEPQPGETGGLLLVNPQGDGLFTAPAPALAFMFQSLVETQHIPLQLVLLNACHSGEQAQAIAQHVPFVIGTSDEVLDEAAWVFSKGFYFSLATTAGQLLDEAAVRKAFNVGQMNAVFMGEPADRFVLYVNGRRV